MVMGLHKSKFFLEESADPSVEKKTFLLYYFYSLIHSLTQLTFI